PAQDDPRHAPAPEPLVGASDAQERAPRAISIWQPARVDGELRFVRPPASRLGDGFGQRTTIARRKTARRICLFGESVALGFLYAPHLTPAGILEAQLNAVAGPGTYEVIDLSRSSESMSPLTATMESSLQLDPDGLVVFTGNNWNF